MIRLLGLLQRGCAAAGQRGAQGEQFVADNTNHSDLAVLAVRKDFKCLEGLQTRNVRLGFFAR